MSLNACNSKLPVKQLKPEHRIPISEIIKRLFASDRTFSSVKRILEENDVVLLTKEEADFIDRPLAKGGLGLKATLPKDGRCRLEVGQIQIAPETENNSL